MNKLKALIATIAATILLLNSGYSQDTAKAISELTEKNSGQVEDDYLFIMADPGVNNFKITAVNLKSDVKQDINQRIHVTATSTDSTIASTYGTVTFARSTTAPYDLTVTIVGITSSETYPLVSIASFVYDGSYSNSVIVPSRYSYNSGTSTVVVKLNPGFVIPSGWTFYFKILIL